MSFDTADENRAFADKYGFPFPLLCDTQREVGLAYGATDKGGTGGARRISYLIGPDRNIRRVYDPVAPNAHPAQVLADLAALRDEQ